MTDDKRKFAWTIWDFQRAQCDFEEALEAAGFEIGENYASIGWDEYDNSIEFYKVNEGVRLSEAQQRIVFDAGFSIVYVNHKDRWETHYSWKGKDFVVSRGWRRRWVQDPEATTTRSVGAKVAPENAGYYEISYWPDSWKGQEQWKDSGFMRIVPDPMEAACA